MINTIICPECSKEIPINDLVGHDLKELARSEVRKEHKKDIEETRRQTSLKLTDDVRSLEKQIEEKNSKMAEYREKEIQLRQEKNKLKDDKREFELTVQRRVDDETKKTEERTSERITREYALRLSEKDQHIESMGKKIEELQRKKNLTSQQVQGEALELVVQRDLTIDFPDDEISEIEKFKNGSDIKQVVKSRRGAISGMIIWECKRVNVFKQEFIKKLKEDVLKVEADYGIIVSTTLSKEAINGLYQVDNNIWVCSQPLVKYLAITLRDRLISVAKEKWLAQHNKDGRGDKLIRYFTSSQYSQQIKEQAETLRTMKEQIDKERTVYAKIWSDRENQITRQIASIVKVLSTVGTHVGPSMPQIEGFELQSLSTGEDDGQAKTE